MDDKRYQFSKIIKEYQKNREIEVDEFLYLKIAEALHQMVDFEKARTVFVMSQDEYERYANEIEESEGVCDDIIVQLEKNMMVKVYDIQELMIFGKPHLKFLCYDTTEAEF